MGNRCTTGRGFWGSILVAAVLCLQTTRYAEPLIEKRGLIAVERS